MFPRSSGVLTHITSLPSSYGIGTMGQAAYDFVDFLSTAHQSYWQVLPLGHTGFGQSPYQCFSAAAGNPYLIDLSLLMEHDLLTDAELHAANEVLLAAQGTPDRVDFETLDQTRPALLRSVFSRADENLRQKARDFAEQEKDWLPDYALFMTLKEEAFDNRPLWEWNDRALIHHQPDAVRAAQNHFSEGIEYRCFLQYLFFEQWNALRQYARRHEIQIIGDIPIYVAPDSVDVWTHPKLFKLKPDRSPRRVAGVPPDYYSATGQLWGNPVYDWNAHQEEGYSWWIWRMKNNLRLFDVVRIDHFRGLESYWEVSAGLPTAEKGAWRRGPGMKLFHALQRELGDLPLIAEDLGAITDPVRKLLHESGFPGMRVLIFGFDVHQDSEHLPHNYIPNSIVYTSTHDSQSICEQVMDICNEDERQFAYRYLRSSTQEALGWSAIKSVFASPARIAMTTLQDILSLGADARMNIPSTIGGNNWRWRVRREALNPEVATLLGEITRTYKRG